MGNCLPIEINKSECARKKRYFRNNFIICFIGTYTFANIRMILDVEVMPGNESSASHTLPHLFSWIDSIPLEHRPKFIRGDCAFGTDAVMTACESRSLPYLFKLKQTPYVKRFIS